MASTWNPSTGVEDRSVAEDHGQSAHKMLFQETGGRHLRKDTKVGFWPVHAHTGTHSDTLLPCFNCVLSHPSLRLPKRENWDYLCPVISPSSIVSIYGHDKRLMECYFIRVGASLGYRVSSSLAWATE